MCTGDFLGTLKSLASQNRDHYGKEVNTMKYSKPELVNLNNALNSIQSVDKGEPFVLDSNGSGQFDATINAYEVDE
jgi:hypothetical protein